MAIGGLDLWKKVNVDKDMDAAAGPEMLKVFQAAADARKLAAKSTVQDWNQATNLVITGEAAGQIMGDWAQGEFAVAGKVAGKDYTCLPGLGVNEYLSTGGDAFYFPKLKDPERKPRKSVWRRCWSARKCRLRSTSRKARCRSVVTSIWLLPTTA